MSKFRCVSSQKGTSIAKGAVVEGTRMSERAFRMVKVLSGRCSKEHEGARFPMVGNLWEWEEIK